MSADNQSGDDLPVGDPFVAKRREVGVMRCPVQGETITMLLRHEDVRCAAADWRSFSSDAPFRVPIPSEESVRNVRQLPIETDPPQHTAYRALTDKIFQRARRPGVIAAIRGTIADVIDSVVRRSSLDAVNDLALPIQSRALAHLLNVPTSHADTWIQWGIHVFQPSENEFKTGDLLDQYLTEQFDRAEADAGGEDFFAHLAHAELDGRRLSREECMGFGNLVFAGGRDMIIHSITSIVDYLGNHPEAMNFLREDLSRIKLASEEFFRVFMPLTQIGRVCVKDTDVHGADVPAGERVGLCWVSANHDESVFADAHKIVLNRRPNPHVSFGFRDHLCQGAAHARLVIRSMLELLCQQNISIDVVDAVPHVERQAGYARSVGFDRLQVRFQRERV